MAKTPAFVAKTPARELRGAARALLEGGGPSLAVISAIVFVQRLAMPVAVLFLGGDSQALAAGALFIAAALSFVRARASDRLARKVRSNLLDLYLRPLEQGVAPSLASSEIVTARLAIALPTLVSWAVDGLAVALAAAIALPAVALLLAYALGPGVLLPLGFAGLAGAAVTALTAPAVERSWTLAWERSSSLLSAVGAGYQGAIDLRAHGHATRYANNLRDEAETWSSLEGRARIWSAISSWGALSATLATGFGASMLLGRDVIGKGDIYRTLLFVLAAIPTLQTLIGGVSNLIHAHGELAEAARQRAIALDANFVDCDDTIDGSGELRLERVGFSYPAPGDENNAPNLVIDELSLTLPRGASVALMGPNGAGKTTLLYLLLGVLRPDKGRIFAGGQPTRLYSRCLHERVAFLAQRPFELPDATIAENLRVFDPDLSDAELLAALDDVGLLPALRARAESDSAALALPFAQLSRGQARRAMLARAILGDADLLALDEPDAHLDEASVAEITALLTRIARKRRVIAVVHDRNLAAFADRIVELAPPSGIPSESAVA